MGSGLRMHRLGMTVVEGVKIEAEAEVEIESPGSGA